MDGATLAAVVGAAGFAAGGAMGVAAGAVGFGGDGDAETIDVVAGSDFAAVGAVGFAAAVDVSGFAVGGTLAALAAGATGFAAGGVAAAGDGFTGSEVIGAEERSGGDLSSSGGVARAT